MQNINLLDVAFVLIYLICCLVLGLIKLDKIKTLHDYALGVKRFSTTVLVATTFATAISAHKTIGSVGKAYSLGLTFVICMFLIPIGWFIMARLLSANLDFFHEKKFMTLGDIMEYHYGKYARWLSSICAIAFTIGIVAAGSMSIGSLLEYFFNIPKPIGMLLTLAVVTLYSTFGGIQSVAFTDVFQFLIFFVALPVACAIGYNEIGGYKNILEKLPQSHLAINKDNIDIFLGIAIFALMPNADIPFIQRALIARNQTQLKYAFNITAILMYPLFIVIALIGLMTYVHNPELTPDSVMFYFTKYHLPTGIVGLMIAGLLAVVMSTQDSFLNTTSTLIARDICKPIWPNITEKQQLLIARISCFTMSALAISLIFIKQDILDLIWFITNFWDPLVIVPFIACLLGFKIQKKLFLLVPITVLIAETITSSITGAFDTRSFAVGVITAAIALVIVKLVGKKICIQR